MKEVRVNGVLWKIDREKETAEASVQGFGFLVNRSILSPPTTPFQVWIRGIPSSGWAFPFYPTANEAVKYISALSRAELEERAEQAEEMEAAAEEAAEFPWR